MLQKLAPEIGAIGLRATPDAGASFSCRCTTSNVIDCLPDPKAVIDVRSRASARKTGAGIWRQVMVSGACVRGLRPVHMSVHVILQNCHIQYCTQQF